MDTFQPDIQLFNNSSISVPFSEDVVKHIITLVSRHDQCSFQLLELVYLDEKGIVDINKEYLNRDYVTDIISFRYDEDPSNAHIEGTLFCCAPRILEQAEVFNQTPDQEFRRILIHGLLHLAGYDDQSPPTKKKMTEREDFYLDLMAQEP